MLDHPHWPSDKGIYMVSGSYDGNDGKVLVGKTFCKDGFAGRWIHYRSHLRNGDYTNAYLQSSFDKHGIDGFVLWTIETDIAPEDLGKREAFWYNHFESDHSKRGWNLQAPTDDGAFTVAEETKEKVRRANLGRKHTEEAKSKMSQSRSGAGNCNWGKKGATNPLFGISKSEQHRQRIAAALSGERNPQWGRRWNDEAKLALAISHTNRNESSFLSPEGESVVFPSTRQAAKGIGVAPSAMRWFLVTAVIGEIFNGWTLLVYDGAKHALTRNRDRKPKLVTSHA